MTFKRKEFSNIQISVSAIIIILYLLENTKDFSYDGNDDALYENTKKSENKQDNGSNDIVENPYYSDISDADLQTQKKKESLIVDLEDTEIVTNVENIYYSL